MDNPAPRFRVRQSSNRAGTGCAKSGVESGQFAVELLCRTMNSHACFRCSHTSHDYVTMLRRLRRNAKPEARLLFSLKPELASPDPEVRKRTEPAIARVLEHRAAQEDSRLIDEVPDHPLQIAGYEPEYALALVDGTGWKMLESAPARAIHPALHALVIEE